MKKLLKEVLYYAIENETTDTITNGKMTLIHKPGKPRRIITNLRPIILLNTFRKILSVAILNRITPRINKFLSLSQTAFRKRSASEIVELWAAAISHSKTKDDFIHPRNRYDIGF